MSTHLIDPNFPCTTDGKTMHLSIGAGDVNPRILSVGDASRGERASKLLDNVRVIHSSRNFITYSGTFEDVPVSIIVTGMGIAMMDFFVREALFALEGNAVIIRLGTCGILKSEIKIGSIIVANSARLIQQNYDYPEGPPFRISCKVDSTAELLNILKKNLEENFEPEIMKEGVDLTCETFYNAQGRTDIRFIDNNEHLLEFALKNEPAAIAMEMETFKLLHLASCSKGRIAAGACMIGLANRQTNEFLEPERLSGIESNAFKAVLTSLINYQLN